MLLGGYFKSFIIMCLAQIAIGFGGYSVMIIVFIFIA